MKFIDWGSKLSFIFLISLLSACDSGNSSGGSATKIGGDGLGIGYSPLELIPNSDGTIIPTNQEIGTSSTGHGIGSHGNGIGMSGSGYGLRVDLNTGATGNWESDRQTSAQSVAAADYSFPDFYNPPEYPAVNDPSLAVESTDLKTQLKSFYRDSLTCGTVMSGMRTMSAAFLPGERRLFNEAMKVGAIDNLYRRSNQKDFKVISLSSSTIPRGYSTSGGKTPNKLTFERVNTEKGYQVRVAACVDGAPVRGEMLTITPQPLSPGKFKYESSIVEEVAVGNESLIQRVRVGAVLEGGKFLLTDSNPVELNFVSVPVVFTSANVGPVNNAGVEQYVYGEVARVAKLPYMIVSGGLDWNQKTVKGISAYGSIRKSGQDAPTLSQISDISLNFANPDESLNPPVYSLKLMATEVNSRIYLPNDILSQEICRSSALYSNPLLNYSFLKDLLFGQEEVGDWLFSRSNSVRLGSVCDEVMKLQTRFGLKQNANDLKSELAGFNCGDDTEVALPAERAWAESCLLPPASPNIPCQDSEAERIKKNADQQTTDQNTNVANIDPNTTN